MYDTLNVTVFKVLSDPTRVRILATLLERSMSVLEIAEKLNLEQPLVSYHLKHLKRYGIVDVERVDKFRIYSVKPEKKKMLDLLLKMSSTENKEDLLEMLLSELKDELSAYIGERMARTYTDDIRKKLKELKEQ